MDPRTPVSTGVLFVQNRTHRAGAQSCLARLLAQETMQAWNPVLVCSRVGWLTQECERLKVPVIIEPFPSSRSLKGRLYGNERFARRVAAKLAEHGLAPSIVHANDHLEGLLGLALADGLGARTALFLRSPGMKQQDYFKYRCGCYDFLSAVGDELRDRVQAWALGKAIELIHDGICEEEFALPKPKPVSFPQKILAIGSPLDWKGWADLTEALYLWEQEGGMPRMEFHFTGDEPDPKKNDLKLARLRTSKCVFLGRRENFKALVRDYDLVINPTWHESFGMAAIETLAAGVPLVSSRSGVIEQVIERPEFLFSPRKPAELMPKLRTLRERWPGLDTDVPSCQERIRQKFMVATAVEKITGAYRALVG